MDEFKDAIFIYESAQLPPEFQVVNGAVECFQKIPQSATTLIQVCRTLEDAAIQIDAFKAKTCGSSYSLAIININMLGRLDDLKFLLRGDVLGDPRTIFVASLRYMTGDIYTLAKDKVSKESADKDRSSSCILCYSTGNRVETYQSLSDLSVGYLLEAEERTKSRQSGIFSASPRPADDLSRRPKTTIFGKTPVLPPVPPTSV